MPRKRPGAVRALQPFPHDTKRTFSRVNGLSAKTIAAVRRIESGPLWPGGVAGAIRDYERFLHRPGRVLYPSPDDVCPCCDPTYARDVLQWALDSLPPRTGRDLRQLVARLDAEFARRTLPDPNPPRHRANSPWWRRRLYERR